MEKIMKKCMVNDFASPVDNNVMFKRNGKLDNYSELQLKLVRIWVKETGIRPFNIGVLRSIPKESQKT